MMGFLSQIELFFKSYPGLLAAAGTPLAIWLGGRLLALVLSLVNLRRVHQIVSPDDPALDEVEAIQRIRFPIEERDPEGVLTQKIAASDYDLFKRPRGEAAMIVLYYKVGRTIVAYLTAEYFKESRTIFFWYIGLRSEGPEDAGEVVAAPDPGDRKAAIRMVKKLFVICNRIGGPWEHVVAEVDSRNVHEAVIRLRRFREYAWQLRHAQYDNPMRWPAQLLGWLRRQSEPQLPSVFKLDLPFMMPLHEAGLVFEAEKHETPAWLVVAPRDNTALLQVEGEPVMPRGQVLKLLGALRASYSDPAEPEYNAYIARFYDAIARTVPERSRLVSRVSDAGGRPTPRVVRRAASSRPRPA